MNQLIYNKHRVSWIERGEGSPVILLHGFCEDAQMWEGLVNSLKSYRFICVDLPGFGQSEAFDKISIDGMAEIVKAVADHLELSQYILLGHSMGGYVAAAYARKYPNDLLGLGLIHSHPYGDTEVGKVGRNKGLKFIAKNGHGVFIRNLMPNLFPAIFKSEHPELLEFLITRAAAGPELGITAALIAMRDRSDNSMALEKINCPVLFVVGKEDTVIPLDSGLKQTSLPDIADIQILEDVGHMGMFEIPDLFAQKIQRFINHCLATHS